MGLLVILLVAAAIGATAIVYAIRHDGELPELNIASGPALTTTGIIAAIGGGAWWILDRPNNPGPAIIAIAGAVLFIAGIILTSGRQRTTPPPSN